MAANPNLNATNNCTVYQLISHGEAPGSSPTNYLGFNPFGYPGSYSPSKLTDMATYKNWGNNVPLWTMTDFDGWTWTGTATNMANNLPCPATPAHIKQRNYLFFDAHVESLNFKNSGASSPF